MSVVIETTIGDITVDLYLDERPRACLNFLKLCKMKYYNFCLFHKIERNFIAQTGDPSGTGRSGESVFQHLYGEQAKYFDSEFKPRIKHKKLGSLSMVNNGNNMNGSQFFITLDENLNFLDEQHSVFGEVTEGFDILVKLNDTICDTNNRPYQDIRITHTVILHDPYEDPPNLEIPPSSPVPTDEVLASDYVRADEDISDNKGKSVEEIEEEIKIKEAKARATILEMVGDIPDADVKPPENVLFVCKLNPVTTDEDLEIIFSRFGVIKSCEVIKDQKTGESLQYAFIEFEREKDCETAYFKMDNVLIDDRRIHVDFSQSVAKLKFDKYNKPIIENKRQPQKEKLALKDKLKKNVGNYEIIFDSDDDDQVSKKHDDHVSKKKKKSSKRYSSSPERRKTYSPSFEKRKQYSFNFKKEGYYERTLDSDDDGQVSKKYKKKKSSEKYSSNSEKKKYPSSSEERKYSSSSENQKHSSKSEKRHHLYNSEKRHSSSSEKRHHSSNSEKRHHSSNSKKRYHSSSSDKRKYSSNYEKK